MPKTNHHTLSLSSIFFLLLLCSFPTLHAQQLAVKTNGLMLAAMAPNIGCEFVVGERSSIDISAFGAVNIYGNKAKMIGLLPEYRYWFNGRPMTREFVGIYNPQIQISAESETKRSIFREKDKTKRSKKESAQHSKSRNKSFVMTSVSAL